MLPKNMGFFGHVVRRLGDSLEKIKIKSKIEGKWSRRHSPIRWLDQIVKVSDERLEHLLRGTDDREAWPITVRGIVAEYDGSPSAQLGRVQ